MCLHVAVSSLAVPLAEDMEEACADDSAYDVPEAQQEEGEIDEDDDIM